MAMRIPPPQYDIADFSGTLLTPESQLSRQCRAAFSRRTERADASPDLYIDPLTPLPLADAAGPVPTVRMVYFIMASRAFAHETISRNVRALQRPGALDDPGTNDSNLFLIHVDAKMDAGSAGMVRTRLGTKPDIYFIRRRRAVMWAGWSMVLSLLDVMASIVARGLRYDMLINLSDADLTLRTDGELRSFFGSHPGRSVMSIVQRQHDPRRYKMHENFRGHCWIECDEGSAFMVWSPKGTRLSATDVIGRQKCCWSRTAPIVYAQLPHRCPNPELPEVFHGSQWGSLHHSLVEYMVRHPFARNISSSLEHTLLPDEAMLQTTAVNSAFRPTLITNHLRFIEWPQLHGDANKYWASLGPQFHGGPMVLNVTLLRDKAFKASAMFARKVDPTIYADVLPLWDRWMAAKLLTQGPADGQPVVAYSLLAKDPALKGNIPPQTPHEANALAAAPGQAPAQPHGGRAEEHEHEHEDDHADGSDGHSHGSPGVLSGVFVAWVLLLMAAGSCFVCNVFLQEWEVTRRCSAHFWRWVGKDRVLSSKTF